MLNLVSIIMPAYNASKFIQESILSVIDQTYSNWELIIVDDYSTDNTIQIVQEFQKKDNRIKLLKQESNKGVAAARNKAFNASKGDFVAFLDSDDIWMPQKLKKQISFMLDNNHVFTYSSYKVIDADSKQNGKVLNAPTQLSYSDMLGGSKIGCLTVVFDKRVISKFEMKQIGHEDYLAWVNILKDGYIAFGIKEVLGKYRVFSGSLSSNKLKAAKWQWIIYRNELDLSVSKALYYFTKYSLSGLFKYQSEQSNIKLRKL